MSLIKKTITLTICFLSVSACYKPIAYHHNTLSSRQAALPTMEHIAITANHCWFKSGDSAFKAYRLAPELQSYSGKPRILIVDYNKPTERPLLVVEAIGNPAQVSHYGPLMISHLSDRITNNIRRWSTGDNKC